MTMTWEHLRLLILLRQAGWEKFVEPLEEMTPLALAGPGVPSPTARTSARSRPVMVSTSSNATARHSMATSGPSCTRLGVSVRLLTRKLPALSSTVALFLVPPLSSPTTTQGSVPTPLAYAAYRP